MNTLKIPDSFQVSSQQFALLAKANRDIKLERLATGELIIMPPTGGNTGRKNIDLSFQLQAWNRQTGLGVAFDSSTGFQLPSGAILSPDLSWVKLEKWQQLTHSQQDSFPPICPDFVVELRSRTDSMVSLRQKMQEYLNNGTSLGWLIEPKNKTIEIYRPLQEVEVLTSPTTLTGENILPGFVLDLKLIFN